MSLKRFVGGLSNCQRYGSTSYGSSCLMLINNYKVKCPILW